MHHFLHYRYQLECRHVIQYRNTRNFRCRYSAEIYAASTYYIDLMSFHFKFLNHTLGQTYVCYTLKLQACTQTGHNHWTANRKAPVFYLTEQNRLKIINMIVQRSKPSQRCSFKNHASLLVTNKLESKIITLLTSAVLLYFDLENEWIYAVPE